MNRCLLPSLFSLLMAGSSFLCTPALAASPEQHAPAPATQAQAEAPVVRATLPNGMRVIIVRDRLAPVVTTEMNYLIGSAAAPEGYPGMAHALEHMMFRGSKGLDRDQLSAIGARMGGNYNADTTENTTQYFYTAPAEDLDIALRIEALRMNGLTLSEEEWTHERGAIEQEVSRDLSSPGYQYLSRLQSILFAHTPYEHDALGTRDSFDHTDAAMLRRFYQDWYAPNNAILIIAGNVDPDQTLAHVRDIFSPLPARTLPAHPTVTPGPVQPQMLSFPTDYPVGLIAIASRMPGLRAHDYATAQILSDVLSSQRGALYDLVPEGKALLAGFDYAPKADAGIGIALAAFPAGKDPSALLQTLRETLASLCAHGVPSDLVDAARRKELAHLGYSANSISGLASIWSEAVAVMGLDSPDAVASAYAAVTPEDVNRLAREVLDPSHAITAILTPRASGHPVADKGFGGSESFAASPDHPVALPQWAQKDLMTLTPPVPTPAPSSFTLPNGLHLIVRPAHVSHTINLYGSIRIGAAMEEAAGKEGVSDITDELFRYGTTTHDRVSFQKALDDIAASEYAGSDFSVSTLTPDFEKGLRLLADNMLHPAFPEKAFKVVQMNTASSLVGLLQSPDYLVRRAIKSAINPPHDPSLRQATPAQVMKLTLQDCRDFYATAYRPDMTTIVVTGDITPQKALEMVRATFGDWHATGPAPKVDLPARPDSHASVARVPDQSSLQDSVVLAESLGLTAQNPEHFALALGNEALGGGFSGHLYRDLRVRTGYVYTVSSSLTWARQRAAYSITFGADPSKVAPARDAAIRDVADMQAHPLNDDELTMAKSALLHELSLEQASLTSIAAGYLQLSGLGLPLDNANRAARAYYEMTAQDVQKAFARWLRPADMAELIKGP
ncbi:M16 family metallopeptidase [Novacetimonas pomaceti]|uniref:Peptidase M16 n=1 Tax=Novacetimonas pomaceti TaxID=2021998 RepID=A0ABX5P2W9_9PROT|nr:peptidase M16 [Novacetimonas pomaceti]